MSWTMMGRSWITSKQIHRHNAHLLTHDFSAKARREPARLHPRWANLLIPVSSISGIAGDTRTHTSPRYEKTGDEKWKTAADIFKHQLDTHPRTAQQQFWHKKRYFNQGWLDGIYMGDIFYAQYTAQIEPDNTTAWGQ